MKKILFFLFLPLFFVLYSSCNKHAAGIPADKITLHMDQTDEELYRIARHARETLPDFFLHLLRPSKDESNFMVKYPFRADRDSGFSMEQLWLSGIRFRDGVYYGDVANTPYYISSIKKGDTAAFSISDITDWMYISDGKIIGGYSIKYLLDQIPEHSDEQQRIIKQLSDLPD